MKKYELIFEKDFIIDEDCISFLQEQYAVNEDQATKDNTHIILTVPVDNSYLFTDTESFCGKGKYQCREMYSRVFVYTEPVKLAVVTERIDETVADVSVEQRNQVTIVLYGKKMDVDSVTEDDLIIGGITCKEVNNNMERVVMAGHSVAQLFEEVKDSVKIQVNIEDNISPGRVKEGGTWVDLIIKRLMNFPEGMKLTMRGGIEGDNIIIRCSSSEDTISLVKQLVIRNIRMILPGLPKQGKQITFIIISRIDQHIGIPSEKPLPLPLQNSDTTQNTKSNVTKRTTTELSNSN